MEGYSAPVTDKSPLHEEHVPLTPTKSAKEIEAENEMMEAADKSTTVENEYTVEPTETEPLKVDLSSDAGRDSSPGTEETSKV